ncbi:MAG: deoxyribodipyrimidine photo-lyase [Planctomycetota bacterium]
MRPLVWFRADLRVEDNTALIRACRSSTRGVVGVFTICPKQWLDHDWGPCRVDYVMRSVADLSDRLERLRIALRVVTVSEFDGVPARLVRLATDEACDAIYFNKEYELNEAQRDEAVREAFEKAGRECHAFTDQTLLEPGSVRTNEGKYYGVFSPFRKKFTDAWLERGGGPLGTPKALDEMVGTPDAVPAPDAIEGFDDPDALRRPDLWKEGQAEAKRRLTRFCNERIGQYKDQRDIPSQDGTSMVSHCLAAGTLSPRQCVASALEASGDALDPKWKSPTSALHWISEVLWREFYKHLLVGYPRLCMHRAYQTATDQLEWSQNEDHFEAWKAGKTGYPIVDAAMRQLKQTGWMHNRLRMISAMFLTKDLWLDWRWGERYFMNTLVDGDLASNNGGWQWSASTGTDAQPYFRIFNPTSQSKKFDPEGAFIREHVPELGEVEGKAIHEPHARAGLFEDLDYPAPIVDHAEARTHAIQAFKDLKG